MPFIANTPESRVARSDSKNPATTCRGITSGGRPCRRPLTAADTMPSSSSRGNRRHGAPRADDPGDERLYCWQHKEQASMSAQSTPHRRPGTTPIAEERASMDTLADRLGLVTVNSAHDEKPGRSSHASPSLCCCFHILDEEPSPPARPSQRPAQSGSASRPGTSAGTQHGQKRPTGQYLSLIPPNTSPQTASQLMAELAKPISQTDEAGYIYMFWLTPESATAAPADAARSLLAPPGQSGHRSASDVIASFTRAAAKASRNGSSGSGSGSNNTGKLLLKIGRANNVQRRLNEWKRQCGYDLSLIRYYPYIPTSSTTAVPRKMPHSHKVERLIHIELTGKGMRVSDNEKCPVCNRDHREWFQVEATHKAVLEVDEIIRRWSDWDEGRS